MGSLIGWIIARTSLGPKGARIAAYAFLAVLAIAILGVGKCTYDRAVIAKHEAKQEAKTAKADRKADNRAAEQRRVDDARLHTEGQEIKEAINDAKAEGRDPRAAYYDCVRLQQAARRNGQRPADC